MGLTALNASQARPLINQLEIGDTLVIKKVSKGCFHLTIDYIFITKTQKSIKAIHDGSEAVLSQQHIKAVRKFEKSRIIKTCKYCTTTSKYTVSLKDRQHSKKDHCCGSWTGYENLLSQLGFSES